MAEELGGGRTWTLQGPEGPGEECDSMPREAGCARVPSQKARTPAGLHDRDTRALRGPQSPNSLGAQVLSTRHEEAFSARG